MAIDVSKWRHVGDGGNTKYYEILPDVLAAVPNQGAVDDLNSVRENVAFQNEHWRRAGYSGVVVVFFDQMASQDKDARRVYQTDPDPTVFLGSALVGGSMLSRAMMSFFLGLAKPRVPIKVCPNVEEALVWARQINDAAKEKSR
jgi:hypothetical protein